nr:hypothetical protein [Escherichia coli]
MTGYIIHCVYVCRISGGEILYAMIINTMYLLYGALNYGTR